MKIDLVYSAAPRQSRVWSLELPVGTTLHEALAASIFRDIPALRSENLTAGVWGEKKDPEHVLQELDRVEIYRALRVDPKVARRERFNRQGAKTAGLFAKTRVGAKAGY